MKLANPTDFGLMVRRRRQQQGLTQSELAKRSGVTRQWLSRFEKGSDDASLSKTLAVLASLNVVLDSEPPFRVPTIDLAQLQEVNDRLARTFSDPTFIRSMKEAMDVRVVDLPDMQHLLSKLREETLTTPSVTPAVGKPALTADN